MTERVDNMLVHERPEVHVVGESLGATAGQAVSSGSGAERPRSVCSVLWTGTPSGHRVGLPREVSVANLDDPVVHARRCATSSCRPTGPSGGCPS
ncbi:alpha/beta-hydrolase family protein [Janibacter indicus]|uniref:Alpha/beta-hydrolase family protein n=1 Tax=Janibacter indicus TaxID=857417 RepID=A0A1L3MFU2_9MICO|nr:alpha/beta-hydrolase family protein [Janibacter indicus]APH01046.1 hypothetical protein ASJ30_05410 [Janibacter indicus]QOK23829.1 alpha/beta-hydrolase family protein [Janibacter indicus]